MENQREAFGGCGGEGRNDGRTAKGGIIKSYEDLDVYRSSYEAMISVMKKILPRLPNEEKYDLSDQLRRSVKAIPRLIAEGHAKRHQKRGFQKYIDDAHAESNETIVSLNQFKDLYAKQDILGFCDSLIDVYDKISRQLYKLAISWRTFDQKPPSTTF